MLRDLIDLNHFFFKKYFFLLLLIPIALTFGNYQEATAAVMVHKYNNIWCDICGDNFNGDTFFEKFTGLSPGGNLTSFIWQSQNIEGYNATVTFYKDDGGYNTHSFINNYVATASNFVGYIDLEPFTFSQTGSLILFEFKQTGGGDHYRVKVYSDLAGQPNNLLYDGPSIYTSNQDVFYTFPINAVNISPGEKLWIGFEYDCGAGCGNSITMTTGLSSGVSYDVSHTFGTGPAPFGGNPTTFAPYMGVYYSQYQAGFPGTLITQSPFTWFPGGVGSQTNNTITIPGGAIIPSDGVVWAGLNYKQYAVGPLTDIYLNNTSGPWQMVSTPQTFEIPSTNIAPTMYNSTIAFYMGLVYTSPQTFTISGQILGNTAYFDYPLILRNTNANITSIGFYNDTGLIKNINFIPGSVPVSANILTPIPYLFNQTGSGVQNFYARAIVNNGTNIVVTSNTVQIIYGTYTPGHIDLSGTNFNVFPIWFTQVKINSTATNLFVNYPNTYNLTCNLAYQFAQTNRTYYNLPHNPIANNNLQSVFFFNGTQNDVITVNCSDVITGTSARYLLTITNFPLLDEINNFRNGTYGTHGQFGAVDLITLLALIFAMIGMNRVNESVAAVFAIIVVGALGFFGIIVWYTALTAGVALVALFAIMSTRKY